MSDREDMYTRIRSALAGRAKSPRPEYDDAASATRVGPDLLAHFKARLERVNGRVFEEPSALRAFLIERGARRGYVDPALAPLLRRSLAGLTLDETFDRTQVDDYAFGITRASGAIAETGTLILTDNGTSRRLAALTPWIHVAVLERRRIHATLIDAIGHLGEDPNVIWVTGPSKTADVEGILIEGVHGPGEQVALIVDESDGLNMESGVRPGVGIGSGPSDLSSSRERMSGYGRSRDR